MAKTPEGLVKKMVKSTLEEYKAFYKMIVPHPMGANSGISDFQVHYKGYFFVIETKSCLSRKKPTQKQTEYMDAVDQAGGFSFVVRNTSDMERVTKFLEWIKRNPGPRPDFSLIRDDLG